ncbi:MAG: TauD/TfdA family dioxygenase [Pseudonocardiaceae bacterium]
MTLHRDDPCRHVKWTRDGQRVVRANQGARPTPRAPRTERQEAMLNLFADIRATLAASAPRVRVRDGEILLIDNYRCWHGRDPYDTPRHVRIMTVRTTDAL